MRFSIAAWVLSMPQALSRPRSPHTMRRPVAPLASGRDESEDPQHLDSRAHLPGAIILEDRTALGKFYGLCQIAWHEQRVTAYDVLGLRKRPGRPGILLAFDQFAGSFER